MMKNISRRAFLKTASVAALAVAAAGVLTSCSDVPADAPGSTRLIPVNFYEGDKSHVVGTTNMEVNVLATKVDTTTLKIPSVLQEGALKDYVVVGNKETPIENGILWVEVKKEEADVTSMELKVYFFDMDAVVAGQEPELHYSETRTFPVSKLTAKIYKVDGEYLRDLKLPEDLAAEGYVYDGATINYAAVDTNKDGSNYIMLPMNKKA